MAMTICRQPGCPELIKKGGWCDEHGKHIQQQRDSFRGSSTERGYGNKWEKERIYYLNHNPLCVQCEWIGHIVPATVVDHIIPHKRDMNLFWDRNNWESLCKTCHDKKTFMECRGLYIPLKIYYPTLPIPISPIILVCGSAGSGKTTYIQHNMQSSDLIIDINLKAADNYNAVQAKQYLYEQLVERNKLLCDLAIIKYSHVYVTTAAPTLKIRRYWQEQLNPIRTVIIETSLKTIKQQIQGDTNRLDKSKYITLAEEWWRLYERQDGEENIIS
jgi:5-methylcytosine-specific restriction protein A